MLQAVLLHFFNFAVLNVTYRTSYFSCLLNVQLLGSRLEEECSSVGREQVNKAYQAYREACIDRDNLKSKLDKMVCLFK